MKFSTSYSDFELIFQRISHIQLLVSIKNREYISPVFAVVYCHSLWGARRGRNRADPSREGEGEGPVSELSEPDEKANQSIEPLAPFGFFFEMIPGERS